ncbi:hypothetical protein LJC26_07500, partial [Desulfovibrio sp. OttesenSCG-928-O18]|nr:hypothetical protein [Desulfovibrio sp. OttesenSCG-928-O18]
MSQTPDPKKTATHSGKNAVSIDADGLDTLNSQAGVIEDAAYLTGTGNDRLRIILDNDNIAAASAVNNSSINFDAGNNTLSVEFTGLADNDGSAGLKDSSLEAGAGADSLHIYGVETGLNGSTVNLGAGNNVVHIAAKNALKDTSLELDKGNDNVFLKGDIDGAAIKLGDGANAFSLYGAMSDAQLLGGSGVDKVTIHVGKSTAKALDEASINLAAGNNEVTVAGDIKDSRIFTGAGADKYTIRGDISGSMIHDSGGNNTFVAQDITKGMLVAGIDGDNKDAKGNNKISVDDLSMSVVETGSGNDAVIAGLVKNSHIFSRGGNNNITVEGGITATADNRADTPVENLAGSGITTDAGNDNILVRGDVKGESDANAAQIKAGDGANIITVQAETVENAIVSSGSGKDKITIEADGVSKLAMDTGTGDDAVTIKGDLANSTLTLNNGKNVVSLDQADSVALTSGTGADNVSLVLGSANNLSLGEGNDTLVLKGVNAATGANSTLTGGDGLDVIQYSGADQNMATLAELFGKAEVAGFEALDLSKTTNGALLIREADLDGNFTNMEMGSFNATAASGITGLAGNEALKTALAAGTLRIDGVKGNTVYFEEGWAQVGTTSNGYKVFAKLDSQGEWSSGAEMVMVKSTVPTAIAGPATAVPADISVYARGNSFTVDMTAELAAYDGDKDALKGTLTGTGVEAVTDEDNSWILTGGGIEYAKVTFDPDTQLFTFTKTGNWPDALPRLSYSFAGENDFATPKHGLSVFPGDTYDLATPASKVELVASFDETRFLHTGNAFGALTGSAGNDNITINGNVDLTDKSTPTVAGAAKTWNLGAGADTLEANNFNPSDKTARLTITGTGDNLIHATGTGGSGGVMANTSVSLTGTGDNTVHANSDIRNSTFSLTAGGDHAILAGIAANGTEKSTDGGTMKSVTVTTSAGDDAVHVAYAGADASAMDNVKLTLNAGHNLVSINRATGSYGTKDLTAAYKTSISATTGDDTVTALGAVEESTITLGAGDNAVIIENTINTAASTPALHTLNKTDITTTTGDDSISLKGESGGAAAAGSVVFGSKIAVGAGDNTVTIDGSGSSKGTLFGIQAENNATATATGILSKVKTAASITTEGGDDVITIKADAAAGTAMYRASITDKGGDNELTLSAGTGMVMSTVSLGAGNDIVRVSGTGAFTAPETLAFDGFTPGKGSFMPTGATEVYGSQTSSTSTITASGATGAGMYGGSITLAGGDNLIEIEGKSYGMMGQLRATAKSSGTPTLSMAEYATLDVKGNGDNIVEISGAYIGAYGAKISLGTGNNTVSIDSGVESTSETGAAMASSSLSIASGKAGAVGENKISIASVGKDNQEDIYAVYDSTLSIGGAVADIEIDSHGLGVAASSLSLNARQTYLAIEADKAALANSTVTASGRLAATFSGEDTAGVIQGGSLTASGGADVIIESTTGAGLVGGTITFSGAGDYHGGFSNYLDIDTKLEGMKNAKIAGTNASADDNISIASETADAMAKSTIDLKGGNNLIEITTEKVDGNAAFESSIKLGGGADTVILGGRLEKTVIDAGAGNDIVSVAGKITGGTLGLGAGNDTLRLASGATVDGGKLEGGAGVDVLQLAGAVTLGSLFANNATATGFEILHLGGSSASLAITSEGLGAFSGITATGGKSILRVSGDNGNTVSFEATVTIGGKAYTWSASPQLYRFDGQYYYLYELKDAQGNSPLTTGNTKVANIWETQIFVGANLGNTTAGTWPPAIPQGSGIDLSALEAATYLQYGNTAVNLAYSDLVGTTTPLTNTGLTLGSANDTMSITMTEDTPVAFKGGFLNLGAGNNLVTVTGDETNAAAIGFENAAVVAGAGNDTLRLVDVALGFKNTTVDLGAGNNLAEASGAESLTLFAGAGNDTVRFSGELKESAVDVGDGANVIEAGSMDGSFLSMGGGHDKVTVKGDIDGGALNLGDGNNVLAADGALKAGAQVFAGAGNDTLTVGGITGGGSVNAGLHAGEGNNVITVTKSVDAGGIITTGGGADKLTLGGLGDASSITLGAGNDTLVLSGVNKAATFTSADKNTVIGGAGLDVVDIGALASSTGVLSMSDVLGVDTSDGNALKTTFDGFEVLNLSDKDRGSLRLSADDVSKFDNIDLEGSAPTLFKAIVATSPVGTDALKMALKAGDVLRIDGDADKDKLYLMPKAADADKNWVAVGNTGSKATDYTIYQYGDGEEFIMVQNGVTVELREPPKLELSMSAATSATTAVVHIDDLSALAATQSSPVEIVTDDSDKWLVYAGKRLCKIVVNDSEDTITFTDFQAAALDLAQVSYPFNLHLTVDGKPYEMGLNFAKGAGEAKDFVQLENMIDGNVYYGTETDGKYYLNATGGSDQIILDYAASGSVINLDAGNDTLLIRDVAGPVGSQTGSGITVTGSGGINDVTIGDGETGSKGLAQSSTFSFTKAVKNVLTAAGFLGKTDITMDGEENTLTVNGDLGSVLDKTNNIPTGSATVKLTGGEHKVSVTGAMHGGSITGVTGNDKTSTISIKAMEGKAKLEFSGGKHVIEVETVDGGSITTGNAADTLTLGVVGGGAVLALKDGDNSLAVTTMQGGQISAGNGKDTVNATDLVGVTTNLGAGDNSFSLTGTMSAGTLTTGAGNDKIDAQNALIDGTRIALG